ncbi:NAD(P)/FAD-dependent oxidoreductase [Paracoccus pantotrophus]|uniref:NAD(P)/FAD-dependent oxidoreductase n=1 Tax=Paracoccus pantotrophus TaxID=82367 RepID=UPI0004B87361|nr:FAD-dependent oxidoreductase [Paracoccus pantotrophus]
MTRIVIIGGGTAGFKALQEILQRQPDADVTMISDEGEAAVERPMLSKELLVSDTALRKAGAPASATGLRLIAGKRAVRIDRSTRQVALHDGERVRYDRLIIATGSRPRLPPFAVKNPGLVHAVRTEADATRLRAAMEGARSIAVIGGGFIGLEVAAAARQRGLQTVVIEAQTTLLARTAPPSLSSYLLDLHHSRGVQVMSGTTVRSVGATADNRAQVITDREAIDADLVVVGIGIVPNIELAAECGLEVADGIIVDQRCRTSDQAIFAAGEVTNYPINALGFRARTECWTAATDQGRIAGRNASGANEDYLDIPWLWTDQYDCNVQYLGLPLHSDRLTRHSLDAPDSWLELGWTQKGVFVGAIGVNAARQVSELRRSLRKGLPIPEKYRSCAEFSVSQDSYAKQ